MIHGYSIRLIIENCQLHLTITLLFLLLTIPQKTWPFSWIFRQNVCHWLIAFIFKEFEIIYQKSFLLTKYTFLHSWIHFFSLYFSVFNIPWKRSAIKCPWRMWKLHAYTCLHFHFYSTVKFAGGNINMTIHSFFLHSSVCVYFFEDFWHEFYCNLCML